MGKPIYRNRPTLMDIANKAGVSAATVSYVLNNTGSVGRDARKLVHKTAKEMGYRVNHVAKATRTGQTQSIGLILPDLNNPFFPKLAQAVQGAARRAGYAVFLIDSEGSAEVEREAAEDFIRRGVDGIVWCPATKHDTLSEFRGDLPIVVIDRPMPGYDTVSADYSSGGALLAEQVLSLGHQRVGMIVGPQSLSSAKQRRDGFINRFCPSGRVEWEVENPFSINLADETRQRLVSLDVSAIICGNDFIAIGALRALHELGHSVPGDVSVLGFDDIPWASYSVPGLATIRQPLKAIGKEASSLLIRRIKGDDAPQVNTALGMQLMPRGSLSRLAADNRHET